MAEKDSIVLTFDVDSDDFTRAGEASSRLKRTLKQMGLPPDIIRRISIVMYEGEINMVIHAHGGKITVTVDDDAVTMVLADVGPGIPDAGRLVYRQRGGPPAGVWCRHGPAQHEKEC